MYVQFIRWYNEYNDIIYLDYIELIVINYMTWFRMQSIRINYFLRCLIVFAQTKTFIIYFWYLLISLNTYVYVPMNAYNLDCNRKTCIIERLIYGITMNDWLIENHSLTSKIGNSVQSSSDSNARNVLSHGW